MLTPWGPSQQMDTYAPGIISVSTASHGGIYLSKERAAKIPANVKPWTGDRQWWEEDCDWCIPYIIFADEIKNSPAAYRFQENLERARQIATRYHPEFKQ